jgi:hypothetical protein
VGVLARITRGTPQKFNGMGIQIGIFVGALLLICLCCGLTILGGATG